MKRTLAVGDIHGCITALETLAEFVGFTKDDTIVALGDYVDRGPDSKGVIDFLIELQKTHKVLALKGNHEIAMIRAREQRAFMSQWMSPVYGGGPTMNSYQALTFGDVPSQHWEFLNETLSYYETETHIFVHANLDPELPLMEQDDDTLFWARFGNPEPHQSGKIMICGHSSQTSGNPKTVGHAVCIDTFVYGNGWLTCLNVDTGDYWQTNEKGGKRKGNLSDLE